jgi:tetratricopeptide (TPR) repeat protein
LFESSGDLIATASSPKPVQELYRLLLADPQSTQYNPEIWSALINGALASWDLGLAKEIADKVRSHSPIISIPAAKTYLECGFPTHARAIALRSLRLTKIPSAEKLQLDMIVARSYAEEGKRQKSLRLLTRIRTTTLSTPLAPKQKAELLSDLGRMQYFLGRYIQAGEYFHDASQMFLALNEWEAATKSLFNTASCYLNSGDVNRVEAFQLIEKCREISARHSLGGPLSYCEAAYGMDAYEHGKFREALDYLRKALALLPPNDHSFRRLHLLSVLAQTYLALGQFHLGKKIGQHALNLAARDQSTKAHSRFLALKAELLWEDGEIDQSQLILSETCTQIEKQGIHTLDEMYAVSRFQLQSAQLGFTEHLLNATLSEPLKANPFAINVYNHSLAQLALNRGAYDQATDLFHYCQDLAENHDDNYHSALATLGRIQIHLRKRQPNLVEPLLEDFEKDISKIGDGPLRTQLQFVLAAYHYQRGYYSDCKKILRGSQRLSRQAYMDHFVLQGWLATIEGKSFRMTQSWQKKIMARYTKIFFSPSIEVLDSSTFLISGHYQVSLDRHPALATLLQHLLQKGTFSSSAREIQTHVWNQSIQLQGWQQKIRNTIMRLRDFFPQTMAPLIIHDENVSLFKEAIDFKRHRQGGSKETPDIQRILSDKPMSSHELSKILALSPATTKRLLKKMAEDDSIAIIKSGRNVLYTTNPAQ